MGRYMGIFVAIPITILAFWAAAKLIDYTDRTSIQLIIMFGALVAASVLTVIICNFFGLDFYPTDESEIDQRGAGPFRW